MTAEKLLWITTLWSIVAIFISVTLEKLGDLPKWAYPVAGALCLALPFLFAFAATATLLRIIP